jgi:hypothetical protein
MQQFGLTLDAEADATVGAKRVLRHVLLDNR